MNFRTSRKCGADLPKQYIRITTPSKEDIAYVKELYKKGTVKKEDLCHNMSFITSYHRQEIQD